MPEVYITGDQGQATGLSTYGISFAPGGVFFSKAILQQHFMPRNLFSAQSSSAERDRYPANLPLGVQCQDDLAVPVKSHLCLELVSVPVLLQLTYAATAPKIAAPRAAWAIQRSRNRLSLDAPGSASDRAPGRETFDI